MSEKLRPHQRQAIAATLKRFKSENRLTLHMACASGKTRTSLRIAEKMEGNLVLVCVPTLALLSQTLEEWRNHAEIPFQSLCVCSDSSVTDIDEPEDFDIEVTTNVDEIRKFLRHREDAPESWSVIFSTYNSLPTISEAILEEDDLIDLVVADEAHRTATGGKKGEGSFKTVLDNDKVPAWKRLFCTATLKMYAPNVKARAASAGYELASMDDETLYGPIAYRFSFSTAIKKKMLADYRVILMGVASSEIEDLIKKRAFVTSDGEVIDAGTLATHLALAKSIKRFGLKKIIAYHSCIKDAVVFSDDTHPYSFQHSLRASKTLQDRPVWTAAVSSRQRARKRLSVLTRLRSSDEIAVVSNARCLTEGIDVPALDAVMFTHPKHSVVDIVQAIGRAIRIPTGWAPKNRNDFPPPGYIIIPVIMKEDDPDASIDETNYATVAAVLRQLRTVDEGLGDTIDRFRVQQGEVLPKDSASPLFSKLDIVDIPEGLDAEFLKKKITSRIVELSADYWQKHFYVLEDWASKHGHARPHSGKTVNKEVRQGVIHKNLRIGDWVGRQRTAFRKGLLTQTQITLLEGLPKWSWDVRQDTWDEHVVRFCAWKEGKTSRPPHIWKWMSRVRKDYQNSSLIQERIDELESLPSWTWTVGAQSARGTRKVKLPSLGQLEQDLREFGALTRIGKKYGVSDNAVKKWFRGFGWSAKQLSEARAEARVLARQRRNS